MAENLPFNILKRAASEDAAALESNVEHAAEEGKELDQEILLDDTGRWNDPDGAEWISIPAIEKEFGVNRIVVNKFLEGLPVKPGRTKYRSAAIYPSNELQNRLSEYLGDAVLDQDTKEYVDDEGVIWISLKQYAQNNGYGTGVSLRVKEDIETRFLKTTKQKETVKVARKSELDLLFKDLFDLPPLEDNKLTDKDCTIYISIQGISDELGIDKGLIRTRVNSLASVKARDGVNVVLVYEYERLKEKLKGLDSLVVTDKAGIYVDEQNVGWATAGYLLRNHKIGSSFLKNSPNISSIEGRAMTRSATSLYNIAEALQEHQALNALPVVDESGLVIDEQGVPWLTINQFKKQNRVIGSFYEKLPAFDFEIRKARQNNGGAVSIYREEDLRAANSKSAEIPVLSKGHEVYIDERGVTWASINYFANVLCAGKLSLSYSFIHHELKRTGAAAITAQVAGVNTTFIYRDIDLKEVTGRFTDIPVSDPETGIYTDPDRGEWGNLAVIRSMYGDNSESLGKKVAPLDSLMVKNKGGSINPHYSLEQVARMYEDRIKLPMVGEDGRYVDENQVAWISGARAALNLDQNEKGLKKRAIDRKISRIWGTSARNEKINLFSEIEITNMYLDLETDAREEIVELKNTLENLLKNDDITSRSLSPLLEVLGESAINDILLALHPNFQSIPSKEFENLLCKFLGEYEVIASEYEPTILGLAAAPGIEGLMNEDKIGVRIFEAIKNQCLFEFSAERGEIGHDEEDILMEIVVDNLYGQLAKIQNVSPKFLKIAAEVKEYFASLSDYFAKKPPHVRDQLSKERPFPDLFQRINIKELEVKKRVLLADEMGTGKSGSVILAKEILSIGSTLILAPSNVVSTWKRYLSSEEGGYFTGAGSVPNVLIVNAPDDLINANIGSFDYVVLSHEKLTEEYMGLMEAYSPSMLVVDEVHKMKNISSGKRSKHLQNLAEQTEANSGYLALLSGTPVPNKLRDVAVLLKLLHPENQNYKGKSAQEVENDILSGRLHAVRADLGERMQHKRLRDIQSMPELLSGEEQIIRTKLTETERAAYEAILDDDEMGPTEKIRALRSFLLNPLIDGKTKDGFVPAKVKDLNGRLNEVFKDKDKIVVFVNGYINGIIRNENSIIGKLNLPPGTAIEIIDGSTSHADRNRIQSDLRQEGKIVVFVSGQTADVGVDFSGAEHGIEYNEPWTMGDRRQQIGRIYRPGLRSDLTVDTLVTEGSIEEGIYAYIRLKEDLINRLLEGGPLNSSERNFLAKADQETEQNLEENSELAREYLRNSDELMRMFGSLRGKGEKKMQKFLQGYGTDYAHYYSQSSARSYEANANRLISSLIAPMAQGIEDFKVIDIGGGPEMLRQHAPETLAKSITTIDINQDQLANGPSGSKAVGSMLRLPVASEVADAASFNFSFHYTHHKNEKGQFERYDALSEAMRILKTGGKLFINHTHSDSFQYPEQLPELAEVLGAKLVTGLSGEVSSSNFRSNLYVLEKIGKPNGKEFDPRILRLKHNKRSRIHDSRAVTEDAVLSNTLGEYRIPLELNKEDVLLKAEERAVLELIKVLMNEFGSIEAIPVGDLKRLDLCRYKAGKKYALFKQLESGKGYVVFRPPVTNVE